MSPDKEKLLPQNIEAEQAVLGSILLENDSIHTVLELLNTSSFYTIAHKKIFSAISSLYEEGKPIDVLLVTDKLKKANQIDEVGGASYISSLMNTVSSSAYAEHYAKIVKEKFILRSLINASNEIITNCHMDEDPSNILDKAEQKIFNISQKRLQTGFSLVSEITQTTVERIASFFSKKGTVTGLSTGFTEFDKQTAGLQESNLVVVAGRPAMGKTSFSLNIAQNVAKQKGTVALFSFEMSKEELVFRMICSEARIDAHLARMGFLPKKDWPVLTNAAAKLSESPIFIDDTPTLSVLEMKSRARRLKLEHGLSLVIVDYLQLMTGRSGRAEHRTQDLSEITRGLKILAKDLKVPVIALSQLSRATEKRNDQRPQLSDLRESGSIEQDADMVVFIYREGYYKLDVPELENKAEIIIGKQRNGPTGTVNLAFFKHCTRFENLSSKTNN